MVIDIASLVPQELWFVDHWTAKIIGLLYMLHLFYHTLSLPKAWYKNTGQVVVLYFCLDCTQLIEFLFLSSCEVFNIVLSVLWDIIIIPMKSLKHFITWIAVQYSNRFLLLWAKTFFGVDNGFLTVHSNCILRG